MTPIKRLQVLWRSGFVHRWHSNDDWRLRRSGDTNDAHSCRVAKLVTLLGGGPEDVLSAIWHDTPELITGDVSTQAKLRNPKLRPELKAAEGTWCEEIDLPPSHKTPLVKMCDLLDAILFAQMHAPDRTLHDDWRADIDEVLEQAKPLRRHATVWKMLKEGERHESRR